MEKRLLVAAFLSLGVLLLWEWLGPKAPRRAAVPALPTPAATVLPRTAVPTAGAATASAASTAAPVEPIAGTQEGLTTLENAVARATFSNRGAVMTSLVLLRHFDDQKRPLELVHTLPDPALKPLAVT